VEIQNLHNDAFDVEQATKRFCDDYTKVYFDFQGTACTLEPPTPKTAYEPLLSKLGSVPSRFGLIPELRGERQRPRWKEAKMNRAKGIQWQ
jgi:hypothetical protein